MGYIEGSGIKQNLKQVIKRKEKKNNFIFKIERETDLRFLNLFLVPRVILFMSGKSSLTVCPLESLCSVACLSVRACFIFCF